MCRADPSRPKAYACGTASPGIRNAGSLRHSDWKVFTSTLRILYYWSARLLRCGQCGWKVGIRYWFVPVPDSRTTHPGSSVMEWQFTPYTIPLAVSSVASVALAIYILRNRHTPGAVPFGMLLLATAEWTASYSLEMACTTQADKIFFSKGLYLGVVLVPALWLLFALQYTGRLQRLRWPILSLLALEPVVTLTLAWSGHPILRTLALDTSGPFKMLSIDYGPWFWVHTSYSYVLLLLGTLVLGPVVLRSPFLYRRQVCSVLIGLVAPWASNALYISGHSPFPGLDLTPLSFIILGVAVGWGLFRFHLFDVVPIARDAVIEDLTDGVIVLGDSDRIA